MATLRDACSPVQAAHSTRWRSRSSFARPYIDCFTSFSRVMWPSTGPVLTGVPMPRLTAASSCWMPVAKRCSSDGCSARSSQMSNCSTVRSRPSARSASAASAAIVPSGAELRQHLLLGRSTLVWRPDQQEGEPPRCRCWCWCGRLALGRPDGGSAGPDAGAQGSRRRHHRRRCSPAPVPLAAGGWRCGSPRPSAAAGSRGRGEGAGVRCGACAQGRPQPPATDRRCADRCPPAGRFLPARGPQAVVLVKASSRRVSRPRQRGAPTG